MDVIQWILNNKEAIIAGAISVLTGLGLLARLTPSPKDDKWIAKLLSILKLIPVPKKEKK